MTKTCSKCDLDLPTSAFYYKRDGKWQLTAACRECIGAAAKQKYQSNPTPKREASRKWRLANLERSIASGRKWQVANPERVAGSKRKWRLANTEKARAATRKWHLMHPEQRAETTRKWQEAHPERVAANERAWRISHPALRVQYEARRRAKKAGAEIRVLISEFCGVCHSRLRHGERFPDELSTTIGHEPPLSRLKELGVTIVIERPEHWICNSHKHNKTDTELEVSLWP